MEFFSGKEEGAKGEGRLGGGTKQTMKRKKKAIVG